MGQLSTKPNNLGPHYSYSFSILQCPFGKSLHKSLQNSLGLGFSWGVIYLGLVSANGMILVSMPISGRELANLKVHQLGFVHGLWEKWVEKYLESSWESSGCGLPKEFDSVICVKGLIASSSNLVATWKIRPCKGFFFINTPLGLTFLFYSLVVVLCYILQLNKFNLYQFVWSWSVWNHSGTILDSLAHPRNIVMRCMLT